MIAHIRKTDGAKQPLKIHCLQVGLLSKHMAQRLGLSAIAQLIGLLHDMGKATAAFAAYLISAVTDPHSAASPHHHAPTGAIFAYRRWFCAAGADYFQLLTAQIIALCIRGHHTGLMDCLDGIGQSAFTLAMQNEANEHYDEAVAYYLENIMPADELDELFAKACVEIRTFLTEHLKGKCDTDERKFHYGMLTRLLLSILIDADRYDSTCFEYGIPSVYIEQQPDWAALLLRFDDFRRRELDTSGDIGRIRAAVSDQCFKHAAENSGVYTLSVPTGGGKTFSSLRYALKHASLYNKRRIFYIIPYNTILDQNAQDIRHALSDYPSILEHHCDVVTLSQNEAETHHRLTERWNSDIILTSLVQFLNACFGASNTDARRLHSLTDSVLIFDEIQSLPAHCKTLFERTITFLSVCCGATVVLCTATQPQLELSCPSAELMSDYDGLFRDMRRASYIPQLDRPMHNSEAAAKLAEMLKSHSVLTIVNTKSAARDIYTKTVAMLSESGLCPVFADISSTPEQLSALARQNGPADILCIHLSTSLCPAHRKLLLRWVKLWLREKARVFCISTSLIEAGINVSFPVVVRSLAGLPSIVQAAGRANRSMEYDTGTVYIWHLCDEKLDKLPEIQYGGNTARTIIASVPADELDMPASIADYFERQQDYTAKHSDFPLPKLNGESIVNLLSYNDKRVRESANFDCGISMPLSQSFRTAYSNFEVIPDKTHSVIVPFGKGAELIARLSGNISLKEKLYLLMEAQQYSVSVYGNSYQELCSKDAIYTIGDTGICVLRSGYYDMQCGVS